MGECLDLARPLPIIFRFCALVFFLLPPRPAHIPARALPTDLDQISHHPGSQKPQTPPMEAGRPSALLRFASVRRARQLAWASSSRLGVIDSGDWY